MKDAGRWTLVKRLFEAALGHPAHDRAAFVQTACGADAELRREVESLLAAHADAGRFAEQPPVPAMSASVAMDGVPSDEQSRPLLHPGARIGAYRIRGFVASGGMGDVYRAHDLHLHRDVALKILPVSFAADRDRVARFEREARLLAALNHPHIAAIYGFEQQTDVASGCSPTTQALVLEFVEGPTLAERLAKGALPINQALEISQQIAEALEAAHEKGIIHRDLKPANIKVTPDGAVKVLDFGLAKAFAGDGGSAVLSQVPTLTVNRTHEGVIAGTPAYMSPEQARGEAVDVQTDIWAFGVVVYELLTGASPFKGTTTADTLAQVLRGEPDCSRLPSDTPPAVRRLVTRCLEKNRRRRFQHMGDLRIQIEDALAAPSTEAVPVSPQPAGARRRKVGPVAMMIGVTALAAALIAGAAGWLVGQRSADTVSSGPVRLSMAFVEPPYRQPYGARRVAISEDGSRIAYASTSRLWTRRLDDSDPIAVGPSGSNPFFSPDGAWVGLFREPGLVKMPVGGGDPVVIVRTSDRPAGASWGSNGTIAFATTEGLFLVSENGGEVKELVRPNRQRKERFLAWPHFLPGGRTLLFTIVSEATGAGTTIAWLDVDTRETRTVITGASSPRYVSAGHLLYASGRTLKAVAFDVDESRTLGEPVSLPRIDLGISIDNGAADFAVSHTGTLIYLPVGWETPGDLRGPLRTLSWIDRQGREEPLPFEPSSYNYPRVSPEGRRVAVELFTDGNRDIWILNLDRLTRTQLTDGPTEDLLPVWSPDGQRVFFASDRAGNMDVYSQPADGATGARVEFAGPGFHAPQSFTADGTGLVVYEAFADTGLARLGQPDRLEKLFYRESDDRLVQVSPDGHWVLYESDESGTQFEIFLRPFPNVNDARLQVSTGGGRYARWNRTGDEVFYVALDGAMMAVPVMGSSKLSLGRATKLFQWDKPPATRSGIPYDLSPLDGRFLVTRPVAEGRTEETQVSVVLNFLTELRATR
jgi:tRNA A-37 threonylcarbamoyl transferase component Bud32